MYGFEYHNPSSVKECEEIFNNSSDPSYLAGGMTLIATMKQRLSRPSDLIDLKNVSALRGISTLDEKKNIIKIGSMTTHDEIANSDIIQNHIPSLAFLANTIGDQAVRNKGTIGGSVCNADPAADYPAAILALDADIVTNKRTIPARSFFKGMFETELSENELILHISVPSVINATYVKFLNPSSRYAIVGIFMLKYSNEVKIAVTGASSKVFRLKEAEQKLNLEFSSKSIDQLNISTENLNSDIHATSKYRASLIINLTKKALSQLI